MAAITEDYVSYEVAKLLKEKGFDECIFEFYEGNKIKYARNGKGFRLSELDSDIYYPHITHQMAMKWLREKSVIIVIQPEYFNAGSKCSAWGVDIWADDNYEKLQGDFPSYEEAVEVALKYSLENLI